MTSQEMCWFIIYLALFCKWQGRIITAAWRVIDCAIHQLPFHSCYTEINFPVAVNLYVSRLHRDITLALQIQDYHNTGDMVANVSRLSFVPQMTTRLSLAVSSGRVVPVVVVLLCRCSSAIKYGSESEVEGMLLFVGGFCYFCEWNVCP
jgi:hypothetical protein